MPRNVPWQADHWHDAAGLPRTVVKDSQGVVIADLDDLDNARLIAAAPEMYRVLSKAAQLLGQDDGADAGRAFDLIEACLKEIDHKAPRKEPTDA